MSTTKILTAAIVSGVILLLVIYLQSLRHETESLRNSFTTLDRQLSALVAAAAAPKATSTAAKAVAAASAAKKALPPGALASFSDMNAMGDPEYAPIIARRERRGAMANSRQAIDAMHLSPSDTSRLKELLAAKWLARTDASDVLDRMGKTTPELRQKAHAAAEAEAEQGIKDLLGADRYAEYQKTYQEFSTEGRNWALFTDFWDSGIPLNSDQQAALARAMVGAQAAFPSDANLPAPDSPTGLRPGDLQLLEAAASFLSPQQLAFLRERKIDNARYRQIVSDSNRRKKASQERTH